MRRPVLVGSLCLLFACGGSDSGGGGGDDQPAPDAPPLSGEKFSLSWGPVTVQPGEEGTKCIWMHLANDTAIKVHQLHNTLSSSSHHLIVYRDDMDTTEQLTPVDCQPFTGALNTTGSIAPMMITQKMDDALTLPDKVAYTLAAHQMIKIEMHYINSGETPSDATAKIEFYRADEASIVHEANILFVGSPDIGTCTNCTPLPAGGTATVHQFFTVPSYLDLSASNIFAITGHTHHFGTDMQVRVAPSATGTMTSVYKPAPFSWSEPVTTTHEPAFSVPKGGGLDFECKYTNTSASAVEFGESAKDEMCFFWAYYYPSQGSKVCIHTQQYGGVNGLNVCCPGDSLCSLVHF
jgi:copper type II ascorbate-dependent monooxygenase-like protein